MIPDLDITIADIRSYFSDMIYIRGLSYFREGRVQILEFTEDFLMAHVEGSSLYTVTIDIYDDYWVMDCDCPYWDDCKHMAATLLKAREMLHSADDDSPVIKQASWKAEFERVIGNRSGDLTLREPKWKIGFVLQTNKYNWQLSAKKFYNKKDGSIGRFENLEPWSLAEILSSPQDFRALGILSKLNTNTSFSPYYYQHSIYEVDLKYNQDVGQLFECLRESLVLLQQSGMQMRVSFAEKPAQVLFDYQTTDDAYSLNARIFLGDTEHNDFNNFYLLSRKPAYLLHGLTLYNVENVDDAEMLLLFLKSKEPIRIPKNEFADFVTEVYPKLAQRTPVPLPEHIQQSTMTEINKKQIVLEEEPDQLRIFMQFQYGAVKVSWEDPRRTIVLSEESSITTVHRDVEAEEKAAEVMTGTRAKKLEDGGWRVLDSRAMNWLFKYIPEFVEQGFEILGRENLKKYKVRTSAPNISVGITSDLDWFDINLNISIEGIELSLKELKKSLRSKSRYVKLMDNSVAQLPEDWFNRFRHLFHFADVAENKIKASSTQAILLDALFEDIEDKKVDDGFKEKLERLQTFEKIQPQELPRGFNGILRPYQKAGLDWLCFLKDYKFGGCLADDMGLGKTIQALVLLQKEKEAGTTQPSLVVCPTSVVYNWQIEAERFTPKLHTLIHTGVQREKSEDAFNGFDIVFTTYGIMMRDFQFLKNIDFHYLILDESQKIKNPNSQSAYVACHLNASHRLVLTGTPVENNTLELWSQFQFLNRGMLGTLNYFRQAFATQIEKYQNEETAQLLQKMIYPFVLRRTKKMVAQDLPEKSEQMLLCELSETQKKAYTTWRDAYRAKLLKLIDEQGLDKSKMNVLEGLTKLRQIANHPALIDPEVEEDSGKFEVLFDLVEDIVNEGHKLLLFSQFVKMLKLVRQRFDKLGISYEYLDGQTRNRQDKVDNFQNNEQVRAFLISLKAGGTGLNLTAADYVIHVDPWWNPAVEMQATDRAHRIGQHKHVFVYKLITKDTVEEKIVQLQERKKKLVSELVTTESSFFKNLDQTDVEVLFS